MKSIQPSTRQWALLNWRACPPGASNNRKRAQRCHKCNKRPLCWTCLDCKQPLRTWWTRARSWFRRHQHCRPREMEQLCSRARSSTCLQRTFLAVIMEAMTYDSPMKRSVMETRWHRNNKTLQKSLLLKIIILLVSQWTILQRAKIWTSWLIVIWVPKVELTQIIQMKKKSWRLRPLSRYEVVQVPNVISHGKSAVRIRLSLRKMHEWPYWIRQMVAWYLGTKCKSKELW